MSLNPTLDSDKNEERNQLTEIRIVHMSIVPRVGLTDRRDLPLFWRLEPPPPVTSIRDFDATLKPVQTM